LYESHSGDQIKRIEMGGTCGTYGEKGIHTGFSLGSLKEGDHLEDVGVDG
jgi:hypothetical protein